MYTRHEIDQKETKQKQMDKKQKLNDCEQVKSFTTEAGDLQGGASH